MRLAPFIACFITIGMGVAAIALLGLSSAAWLIGFVTAYIAEIVFRSTGGPEEIDKMKLFG
jgi:hypothetical protein